MVPFRRYLDLRTARQQVKARFVFLHLDIVFVFVGYPFCDFGDCLTRLSGRLSNTWRSTVVAAAAVVVENLESELSNPFPAGVKK